MTPSSIRNAWPAPPRLIALVTALGLAVAACQPAEPPAAARNVAPVPPAPPPKVAETAVESLLLQYQDSGTLSQNGFQIAEEGGIVALDQFDRWTVVQLRELLHFVETPNSGLSDATARRLAQTARAVLAEKKVAMPASTPAAPPKAAR